MEIMRIVTEVAAIERKQRAGAAWEFTSITGGIVDQIAQVSQTHSNAMKVEISRITVDYPREAFEILSKLPKTIPDVARQEDDDL